MKKQISEAKLRNAIKKTKGFQEFICEYQGKMRTYGFYNAVRISYSFSFEFTINYHDSKWCDETGVETYKKGFEFDDTIITNYDFRKNPSEVFAKLITRYILDIMVLKDVDCCCHIIDTICANCLDWEIDGLWAWSSKKVGVYHIEQECGEGWYIMPKEPEVRTRNYIDMNEDN